MKNLFFIGLSLFCFNWVSAQSFETDLYAKDRIKKLYFMVGNWEGNGWRMSPDGTKNEFYQSEKVQFKLDSTAILIEGKGTVGEKVIHNALAIVTSNKENEQFSFQSFLQNGMKGIFSGEIKTDSFYWYPNENTRYIITINEKGEWFETGEFKRQEKWFKFFEMTLSKK